ncbi:uncharacterized protein LOC107782738 [Nicotiana tabacum]|uniref:Uncharacterized protein LOC107782738 n=2 Tax=Nicotiana TaxID=4085 RepID=A0A1S3Z490_TOBAC|nr:PREDICTED: uncharacterized protein LOC104233536 [Nicotiana sylvestris]XP_016459154.1 PREDICTED: uncharacterized protein LOC107782738 [Nicotiana tabacum]
MTDEVINSTITTNNNNKFPLNDNIDTNNIVKVPKLSVNGNNGEKTINTKEKKKQGAFSFLRAASLKLRRRSIDLKHQKISQELVPNADSKGDNWKKLVGSMRPLHLQDNQSPPTPHQPPPVKSPSPMVECCENVSSPSPSTSSAGTMSQYASANNLQELYGESSDDEEEDPDQVFDAIGADEMIDAKAENFIAQFYEQMRRQQ